MGFPLRGVSSKEDARFFAPRGTTQLMQSIIAVPYPSSPVRILNFIVRKSRAAEYVAGVTIALLIVLNVAGVASRNRPSDTAEMRVAENLPAPARAGDTLSPAAGKQLVKAAHKKPPAPTYASPPLPSQAASVNLFQPQKRILDATGSLALQPNRAAPLPLKLDILAHVDGSGFEGAPAARADDVPPAAVDVSSNLPAATAYQVNAGKKGDGARTHHSARQHGAPNPKLATARQTERKHAAGAPSLAASTPITGGTNKAAKGKVQLAAQQNALAPSDSARRGRSGGIRVSRGPDLTPGELVLRALRGPA